ncbi:MAG TPA: tripartite tricarboxylate transporter substrate binding protein [Xanthobacteraceae bacterium]|jgi:tripartite-type tricarboxylate transporter receptor subunit TctC|nr:tripartite tricarboxylate transporter substrate binding protein [Xanthobacteraceae bacterium]
MPSIRSLGVAAACLCVTASISPAPVQAQEWPTRPVKIVVAFSPGGSADQLGRLLAAELSNALGQQFYVENKPGNSGSIGSAQVARAEPDGYTLLVAGSGPHLTGPAINPNIGYDPLKDFTHVAMIAADSFVLAANPGLGARSVADLVKLAREKPLTSSSPGAGSLGHLILEEFKRRAGVDIQHVPAPNSGMLDVLGNHISMSFTTLLTAGEHIRSGGMVALGVTSSARNPVYPSIPTFAEQGYPDVRGETWFWLAGPRNLPPGIVARLNQEVRRIVKLPKTQGYISQMALMTRDLDQAAVTDFVREELAYWAPLAKAVGLRVQ